EKDSSRLLVKAMIFRGQTLGALSGRGRQKKYERTQSRLVSVEGANATALSRIEMWAMSAETRLMAKPALAHSSGRAGSMGRSSAAPPAPLAHESSPRK